MPGPPDAPLATEPSHGAGRWMPGLLAAGLITACGEATPRRRRRRPPTRSPTRPRSVARGLLRRQRVHRRRFAAAPHLRGGRRERRARPRLGRRALDDGAGRDRQGGRAGADGLSPRRGPPARLLPADVHPAGPRHLRGGHRARRREGDRQLHGRHARHGAGARARVRPCPTSTPRPPPTPAASIRSAPPNPPAPCTPSTSPTPAPWASRSHCSSRPRPTARLAICGPVLDVLLDAASSPSANR